MAPGLGDAQAGDDLIGTAGGDAALAPAALAELLKLFRHGFPPALAVAAVTAAGSAAATASSAASTWAPA